jgi:tetratricopeptide (TPR) repeat protein
MNGRSVAAGTARLLRGGVDSARSLLPEGDGPVFRLARPLSSRVRRAILALEASPVREREQELRTQLAADPDDSAAWWELGLCLITQRRLDETVEAWLRAAELGPYLNRAVHELHSRADLAPLVRSEATLARMRGIADAKPDSAYVQFHVGAFFLDLDQLEPGRALVRRGYQLSLEQRDPELAAALSPDGPSLAPSFFVIGPHKSGTTSLFSYLVQHPRVIAPPRKEVRFWQLRRDRPLEVYDAYFPPLPPELGVLTGDGSPSYLQQPKAATEIAGRFPAAKVIVLRRDPVARAYSHYQMLRRLHIEHRAFDRAIADEQRLLRGSPPLTAADLPGRRAPYLLGSAILPHLQLWVDALAANQVLVVDSSALSHRPSETTAAVFEFLGLPPAEIPDVSDRNVGAYDPIDPAVAAELREWFAPHEAALDAFLEGHPAQIAGV